MTHVFGRHFLQIPGPSPVPDRVLRAMSAQVIDHRGPEFGELGLKALAGMKMIFKTQQDVIIYPSSGTGAWEAVLANVLKEGDRVLMYETGHFATLWKKMAEKLGVRAEFIGGGTTTITGALTGDAEAEIRFAPRPDFGAYPTRLERVGDGVRVLGTAEPIMLHARGVEFEIVTENGSDTAIASVDNPTGPPPKRSHSDDRISRYSNGRSPAPRMRSGRDSMPTPKVRESTTSSATARTRTFAPG